MSLSTDHSPIFFALRRLHINAKSKGLWVFNSSLTLNKEFVEKIKEQISTCVNLLKKENILDDQARRDNFSNVQTKKIRLEKVLQEKKLKNLESNMNNYEEYNVCKTQLKQIYKIKENGIKIRSKCE